MTTINPSARQHADNAGLEHEAGPMSHTLAIVTATDLSAPSWYAAQRAAMLAQASGAVMTLVHTVRNSALDDLRRWFANDDELAEVAQADARQCLETLAAELSQRHGVDVRTHMTTGHPVEQVIQHAGNVNAGLVVTGTRGAGFFRGVVVGSTAERMAKRSPRPVLMVRQAPQGPYRRILVPVDFSRWSRDAIELAKQIAPQASLTLMHAVEVEHAQRRRPLDAVIAQEGQTQDCDLVVIGRQGRHALDEFLLGSTTRMVLANGPTDVLISSSQSD